MAEPLPGYIASDMEVSHKLMEKLISNYGLKAADSGRTVGVSRTYSPGGFVPGYYVEPSGEHNCENCGWVFND
jgi:hypothetical protein